MSLETNIKCPELVNPQRQKLIGVAWGRVKARRGHRNGEWLLVNKRGGLFQVMKMF